MDINEDYGWQMVRLILCLLFLSTSVFAETNTVSSTVVTNNTPPTANSPSVVVNNSDVCKTAVAGAVQTQILGISSGITVTDENCERIKLSRSLYSMGMKVAAVSQHYVLILEYGMQCIWQARIVHTWVLSAKKQKTVGKLTQN
jgi:hypothetical protein